MDCMNRTMRAFTGGFVVLAAVPVVHANAAPDVPDLSSYPKVSEDDYTVRPGLAYSVRGFRTPSGLYCTSSNRRAMYAPTATDDNPPAFPSSRVTRSICWPRTLRTRSTMGLCVDRQYRAGLPDGLRG